MPNTSSISTYLAIAMLAILALTGPVQAAQQGVSAFAEVGERAAVPVGHAEFCRAHRQECGPNAEAVAAMELTESRWSDLVRINTEYNSAITPVTDAAYYNVAELWTYPDAYGDCEDIALAKRRALIGKGWNPSTLLMTVVREANGNGHAVLMVRTDRGDLVLDNQDGTIRLWSDTPYKFIKRQSQADAGKWVDMVDDREIVVATAAIN